MGEALVGQTYVFRTTVALQGSAPVQFSIQNTPGWASFNVTTGVLSGVPKEADGGIYDAIRISAHRGTELVSLPMFTIRVRSPGAAGRISLSWLPPLENEDGSALTNLSGYRIYLGRAPSQLRPFVTIRNPGATRYMLESLETGSHFIAVRAMNAAGVESKLSQMLYTNLR